MGLKENIKRRRLELNLTLEDVSNKLCVSKPTLQRYESGVISNIPSDKIEKLAIILDTTPAYLMDWEENSLDTKPHLTEEQQALLYKYNSLDYMGKRAINAVLDVEFERCN